MDHSTYNVSAYGAIGDGTEDDTTAVQAALDDAAERGGVVVLPPGEYRTTHTLLYGSDTVIYGPGATIQFEPSDANATALVSKSYDGSVETERVSIEHLTVDAVDKSKGNGIGIAKASRVGVHACWTSGLNWHLVDIAGGSNVLVTECYAANLETAAYQADNLTSSGGLVVELPDGSTENAIVDGTNNENVRFVGNFAHDCGRGVHLHRNEGHNLTVRGNRIHGCSDVGVLGDEEMTWHDVTIANNTISGSGESSGISLNGSYDNLLVQNNTVRDHGRWGIAVHPNRSSNAPMKGVRIVGNVVERTAGTAVSLNSASGEVTGNYVYDVAAKTTGSGDESTDGRSDESSGDAHGSEETSPVSSTPTGVAISDSTNVVVSRNTVRDVHGVGIRLYRRSADVVLSNNALEGFETGVSVSSDTVVGVSLESNRLVGSTRSERGIDVTGATNCRVGENALVGLPRGITVEEAIGVRLDGNELAGDATDEGPRTVGCEISASSDVSVAGNDVGEYECGFVIGNGSTNVDGEFARADVTIDDDCTNVVVRYPDDAPPRDGSFETGSVVRNTTPSAGGYVGWICVAAGTPGTWRPYGSISTDEPALEH